MRLSSGGSRGRWLEMKLQPRLVQLGWFECHPRASIPGQGTRLGCGFGSRSGRVRGHRSMVLSHTVFLSLSLPPFPSL